MDVLESMTALRMVDLIVVPTLTDLEIQKLGERSLTVWFVAIALGKPIIAHADVTPYTTATSETCLQHQVGMQTRQLVCLSQKFASEHSQVSKLLQELSKRDCSKWHVRVAASCAVGKWNNVRSLADFQAFVLKARRLARTRGHHGTYARQRGA